MTMSNSPLVVYTKLSPNNSGKRTSPISKITPHHMSGDLSIETCGAVFASKARLASSNYGIGSDGRVGMYVEESNRAWTSSSNWNDQRAVTIEVANCKLGGDWPVSSKAWNALVDLCVDIVKRNPGIKRKDGRPGLYYDGTKNGSLTKHKMYSNTDCPGTYIDTRLNALAAAVNAKLDALTGKWMKSSKGWWYKYSNGSYPKSRWLKLDAWYYFNSEGYAVTGWHKIGGFWYYFSKDCRMQTGWKKVSGKWYYLNPSKDGNWPTGSARTGWLRYKNNWYYLNKNGKGTECAMRTGWFEENGKKYYLQPAKDGIMACAETIYIDGKRYTFDKNGALV